MKLKQIIVALVTLVLTASFPTKSLAQLGAFFSKKDAGGSNAAADGAGFLKQLTPGAVKFSQAYAKYYEALGNAEAAAKLGSSGIFREILIEPNRA